MKLLCCSVANLTCYTDLCSTEESWTCVEQNVDNNFCSRWTVLFTHLNLFTVTSNLDFIGLVIHNHILRTSKITCTGTVIVLNVDADIVSWNDFSDKYIGTVPLEGVVCSIKSFVMRVTPATAFTCFENTVNRIFFQVQWLSFVWLELLSFI